MKIFRKLMTKPSEKNMSEFLKREFWSLENNWRSCDIALIFVGNLQWFEVANFSQEEME